MKEKARFQWNLAIAALMVVALILSANVPAALAQDSTPGEGLQPLWEAEFWANMTLSGEPVLRTTTTAINYDWGNGSPSPQVPADHFSARWTAPVQLSGGIYHFTATSDDGMRVWVDDQLIIDMWYDHPALTESTDVPLAEGEHSVRVDYYEDGGVAVARLAWQRVSIATTEWQGEYFANIALEGSPALVRIDEKIDFDWGDGSPAPGLVPPDRFSVRWTRTADLDGGVYRFVATADDGVRVWVDNDLIINEWIIESARTYTADVPLAPGQHQLRVEYFENTGLALISVSFTQIRETFQGWRAQYFNNMSLQGPPALVRTDPAIDFDWGAGSPAPGIIQPDHFSARWQALLDLPDGEYRFSMTVDDGGRLWIGDQLLIDAWRDQAATTYSEDIYLSGGPFPVTMEYYEDIGQAVAVLSWIELSAPPPANAVVIDSIDPEFVRGGSPDDWHREGGGYGGTFLWTWNSETASLNYNWARWTPNLNPGTYEVRVYIPNESATTSNARYQVAHANEFTLRVVDQSAHQGAWVSLGMYYFNGTVEEYVSLTDVTYEPRTSRMVAFDAVEWIPQQ
jgi:hypothetical protein